MFEIIIIKVYNIKSSKDNNVIRPEICISIYVKCMRAIYHKINRCAKLYVMITLFPDLMYSDLMIQCLNYIFYDVRCILLQLSTKSNHFENLHNAYSRTTRIH